MYISADGIVNVDDILISSRYSSEATRVLMSVTIQGYRYYIVQDGRVKDGKFEGGRSLLVYKPTQLSTTYYPHKWVEANVTEENVKDGDVLVSADKKHYFIVRGFYSNSVKLHRLSGGDNIGFDSFSYYQKNYGPLEQISLPTTFGGGNFSDRLSEGERKGY